MTYQHILINYSSLCSELWHKIVLFYVSLILFFIYTKMVFELSYSIFGMCASFILFEFLASFCYYLWVLLHFLVIFMSLIILYN